MLLEYENEILLNLVQEDCLNVFAKGIPLENVLLNIFRTYASEVQLVFVLSASQEEEHFFCSQLQNDLVKSITTEYSASERKELYCRGGVFFITSRILVVDFLKNVVPVEKVTGMVVLRAHDVVEKSQEAFILRLYRSNNKTGFIKAFSQSPASFLIGYSRLNRVMRCCFLANVKLWPRFHSSIKQTLSSFKTDVVEIQLQLTGPMKEIQNGLLDLVTWSVSELKRLVPALNDEDISPETALMGGFDKLVGAYVDPVWNTINTKAKDILNDLKIFRLLLTQLTMSDCVSFYSTLKSYTSKDAVFKSSWVITKSAENVITAAKRRIFTESSQKQSSFKFTPETHPKWLALSEILNEISIKEKSAAEENEATFGAKIKTIIFAEDTRTCGLIRDYLCYGSEACLAKLARNTENISVDLSDEVLHKLQAINQENKHVKKFRPDLNARREDGNNIGDVTAGPSEIQMTMTQIERKYEDVEFLQAPVFIRPTKQLHSNEPFPIVSALKQINPDVVILFDPRLDVVRTVEVHRSRVGKSQEIKVYFLSFHNSVEEQIYLTMIQREKKAFESLIQEKGSMVVPNEREAKDDLNQDLWRDPTKANETVKTSSKRHMDQSEGNQVILVDMREFRSELPSLIHKRGIDLEPLTLDVGDYILTPDICVERKSISDLIGSLNSGRLYKQAEAMTRHYKKAVLLIEHEKEAHSVTAGMRLMSGLGFAMPKLQMLTMQFPKLKLIWSPGAHYTSEIFHELKRGKDQPDPERALNIIKQESGEHSKSRFNPAMHQLISKMPGIDSRNVYKILSSCESLTSLANFSKDELSTILENQNAAGLLHNGFHGQLISKYCCVEEDTVERKPAKVSNFRVGLKARGNKKK